MFFFSLSLRTRPFLWNISYKPKRTMATKVHAVAQTGFGTGTNDLYDRARPSYPSQSIAHIREVVKSPAPLNVVEIGAGTGIFTRALLAHPAWTADIHKVKAIEPSAGMREVFSKTVADDRATVAEGTFNHTGVEDGWADIVIIAQAFHWCPDYDSASAEFARILKPDGATVCIWNLEDRDGAGWVAQLRDRVESHEQGTPQFRLGLWRQAFDTASYTKLFQPPEEKEWTYHLPGSVEICVNRAQSKSYIAVLPPVEKAQVVEDIKAILAKGDGKVWMDESQGLFEYPYKTLVVVARKNS
ncbi:hypothetical protein SERLA73DRAFT_185418 [Serpula lacrymans var. lacrymans S7.3]|uniref:Methyltransferase type 11 domain-containing protein n=2 Tax=Serpula lacrymans var. lacrymans TaxID=341189 RepID=F8Q5S7_SERL3|nr:uncharacterized protein SERLADRAFT_473903 [Serpula lacrymans var. lacrymans S7.9]EGN95965.1 hypothetical protein SERLA73DRAFT_185418 [Serpula lacrymans var. lacrymans S7.3]EGO21490.1 hypothetical protein SERLADRAFT_473903 [Serpula lacrymans var. lacrymans S7.9]